MEKILTIAIPTFNRYKYLERALKSIAEQFDDSIEIIVSDNASEDSTEDVVQKMMNYMPIKYLKKKENIGADRNFLQCLHEAEGKYVVLLGDDDLFIEGRISILLDFLKSNEDLSLVFLNHTYFTGEYDKADPGRYYNSETSIKSGLSKKEFFDYVKGEIIYMSSVVLSTKRVRDIKDAEKYSWTFFMHSCIAFESTKNDNYNLGIVGMPCIAKDHTGDEHANVNKPEIYFAAYFKGEKYLFYELAPSCGYDKVQMQKIYYSCGIKFEKHVLRLNAENYPNWKECFWKYAYPAIKEFPAAWIKIIPFAIMPRFLARFICNVYKIIKSQSK